MLDKETCKKLAKELKIDIFTVFREYLQLLFLKYLYVKSAIKFHIEAFGEEDLEVEEMALH